MKGFLVSVCMASMLLGSVAGTPAFARPVAEQATAATSESVVTLLDAGASPKRELRLHPKLHEKLTLEMKMQMAMTQSMGAMQMPAQKLPATISTLVMEVTELHPNGDISYDVKYADARVADEAGVQPAVLAATRKAAQSMVGMTGKGRMSNRGVTKEMSMEAPPNADPTVKQQVEGMKQSISQFSMPTPEEAIGVGGKWKVENTFSQMGMTIKQTTTLTLAAMDGDAMTLKFEVQQDAPEQDINLPGMPAGAMRLLSLKGSGSGSALTRLDQLAPVNSEASMKSDSRLRMTMNGNSQELAQHMDITVTIKQVEARAEKPAGH